MLWKNLIWGGHIFDNDRLESITRWESILAPHQHIKVKGHRQTFCYGEPQFAELDGSLEHYRNTKFLVTEKIDGRNMALIFCIRPNRTEIFVRSRREIIGNITDYCVQNEQLFFTEILRDRIGRYGPLARSLAMTFNSDDSSMVILYGEYYGPKIQKRGKRYGKKGAFRLFGAKVLPNSFYELLMQTHREEHRHYRWMHSVPQIQFLDRADKYFVPCVPILGKIRGDKIDTPEKIQDFLQQFKKESIVANRDLGIMKDTLEGVVIRAEEPLRQWKLKYRDYGVI